MQTVLNRGTSIIGCANGGLRFFVGGLRSPGDGATAWPSLYPRPALGLGMVWCGSRPGQQRKCSRKVVLRFHGDIAGRKVQSGRSAVLAQRRTSSSSSSFRAATWPSATEQGSNHDIVLTEAATTLADDVDRQDFLRTLAETGQKTGFEVHAYCLMHNHFHLVVETPEANLVAGMRWLLSTCLIGYLAAVRPRPGWMRVDRWLGEHGMGADTAEGRQEFERRMVARRKSDPVKLALAARLRRETTLTMGWIAARLKTGTRQSTTTRLQESKRKRQTER